MDFSIKLYLVCATLGFLYEEASACGRSPSPTPPQYKPYYMDQICQRQMPYRITFNTAARLRPHSKSSSSNINCTVLLDATVGRKIQVEVRIHRVCHGSIWIPSTNCSEDQLTFSKVYNDSTFVPFDFADPYSSAVSEENTFKEQMWLQSDTGVIAVNFVTSGGAFLSKSFEIIATSYHTRGECSAFRCSNYRCIANQLKCDGENNCLDGTDEGSSTCGTDRTTSRPIPPSSSSGLRYFTYFILFWVVFGLLCCTAAAGLVSFCCCLCCKSKKKVDPACPRQTLQLGAGAPEAPRTVQVLVPSNYYPGRQEELPSYSPFPADTIGTQKL